MDVCYNCWCSLEGEIRGGHGELEGWLCIRCLVSLLGPTADENHNKQEGRDE